MESQEALAYITVSKTQRNQITHKISSTSLIVCSKLLPLQSTLTPIQIVKDVISKLRL